MRLMGLAGMTAGPSTNVTYPAHQVYPCVLRSIEVSRPNQVWSTDITYIRLARGVVYLVAIIDWYSRQVLAWRNISRSTTESARTNRWATERRTRCMPMVRAAGRVFPIMSAEYQGNAAPLRLKRYA